MHYVIKTNKYHKIVIKRRYLRKFNINDVTIRNLLAYYLSLACEEYNTEASFNKFLGKNYDLRYYVSINPVGSYTYLSLTLTGVDPKYINDPNYNFELILSSFYKCTKPVIKKNSFDKELFNRAKEMYISNLLYSLDDENKNALDFTINQYFHDTYGMVSDGNIDELENITPRMLYNYYLSILNDECIDYICGDVDVTPTNDIKILPKHDFVITDRANTKELIYKEANTNQCYLNIIYDLKAYTNSKDFYTASFINYEFGGKSNSRLFQIVREKYGLCYHISSTYLGSRGIIIVTAIINKKDLDITITKIDEVFNNLLEHINLDLAKKYFNNLILEEQDKMSYLINNSFLDNFFTLNYPSTNEKNYYNSITYDDIKELYYKISKKLVCIYGGNKNE